MPGRRPSGFTLIELMVATAIVGVLASVAIPAYARLALRSRTAERRVVMTTIRHGVTALFVRDGKVSLGAAALDPPGTPTTTKRPFVQNLDTAWDTLTHLAQIEGATYYSYAFTALEPGGSTPATLVVSALGDLDGDGVQSVKQVTYERREGQYQGDEDHPPSCFTSPGASCTEDVGTF